MKEYKINLVKRRQEAIDSFVEITNILHKYEIEYWLDYGTLLGAIRDKTIIPWDGEFDISTLESSLDLNSPMWKEIKGLGYDISFGEFNIKIRKESQLVGSFVIDLHRYKETNKGALYEYGLDPKGFFNNLILYTYKLFGDAKRIENTPEITFTCIYNEILNKTGAKISEIDTAEIRVVIGKMHRFPFTIYFKDHEIKYDVIINRKTFTNIFYSIINILPSSLNKAISAALQNRVNNIKFHPLKKVYVKDYYKSLSSTEFCGLTFPCFKDSEKYLSEVYGEGWRVPTNKWELLHDSPLSKNK